MSIYTVYTPNNPAINYMEAMLQDYRFTILPALPASIIGKLKRGDLFFIFFILTVGEIDNILDVYQESASLSYHPLKRNVII